MYRFPQAAQGAVRLEGDVITAHGSVSSLPTGGMASSSMAAKAGRGMGSSSPADNASVCTCTCTRARSRNDLYRAAGSPPYASGSIYDGGGGGGGVIVGFGGAGAYDASVADEDACGGGDDAQDIQLDTFYDGYGAAASAAAAAAADPYSCRQRVVHTMQHRSSI